MNSEFRARSNDEIDKVIGDFSFSAVSGISATLSAVIWGLVKKGAIVALAATFIGLTGKGGLI